MRLKKKNHRNYQKKWMNFYGEASGIGCGIGCGLDW